MFKSRHQSLYDFLQCLQKEYVSAELRSKIYPSAKDRKYYRKIMGYKEEKIKDISLRNDIPNIFNSDEEKQRVYKEVHAISGIPNLVYKDEQHRRDFFIQDVLNYFSIQGEFKVDTSPTREYVVGTLIDNDILNEKIEVCDTIEEIANIPVIIKFRGGDQKPVLLNKLSRIL